MLSEGGGAGASSRLTTTSRHMQEAWRADTSIEDENRVELCSTETEYSLRKKSVFKCTKCGHAMRYVTCVDAKMADYVTADLIHQ